MKIIVCSTDQICVYQTNSDISRSRSSEAWYLPRYISKMWIPPHEHFGANLSSAREVKTSRVSLMNLLWLAGESPCQNLHVCFRGGFIKHHTDHIITPCLFIDIVSVVLCSYYVGNLLVFNSIGGTRWVPNETLITALCSWWVLSTWRGNDDLMATLFTS